MKLVSCQVFRTHDRGRPVVNGFVSYVHPSEPHLMLCTGYEDYSDAYDEYAASLSRDHGVTWSGPEMVYAGREVEGGRLRYAEPAAFYDAERDRLVVLADENFYPRDTLDVDGVCRVVARTRDGATGSWSAIEPLDLTPGRSLAVSFSFALAGADGRVLVPAMRPLLDGDGKPVHYRGCWATADEPLVLIGERAAGEGAAGSATAAGWRWHLSDPVPVDLERTSRGLNENTLAELADGRLAMVCRGDNSMFPERPGYKWLSFSEDGGHTWSAPAPLPCDRGDPVESSSTGSALFRDRRDGRLYWMGNLCLTGRARGNYPRVPLVIAAVREEPFALRRDTIFVIGDRRPGEPEQVQMSNFRFYQDRVTGHLVVFVTRYAERSPRDWKLAHYYRYEVELS